jgi:MFS family permease
MMKVGRARITTYGLLAMGVSMYGFAAAHYIEDPNLFMATSIVIRFIQGIASSSIQTSSKQILLID